MKEQLITKIKKQSPQYTDEQTIQIVNFLMTLSEVYYENEAKSNPSKKAA